MEARDRGAALPVAAAGGHVDPRELHADPQEVRKLLRGGGIPLQAVYGGGQPYSTCKGTPASPAEGVPAVPQAEWYRMLLAARMEQLVVEWLLVPETRIAIKQITAQLIVKTGAASVLTAQNRQPAADAEPPSNIAQAAAAAAIKVFGPELEEQLAMISSGESPSGGVAVPGTSSAEFMLAASAPPPSSVAPPPTVSLLSSILIGSMHATSSPTLHPPKSPARQPSDTFIGVSQSAAREAAAKPPGSLPSETDDQPPESLPASEAAGETQSAADTAESSRRSSDLSGGAEKLDRRTDVADAPHTRSDSVDSDGGASSVASSSQRLGGRGLSDKQTLSKKVSTTTSSSRESSPSAVSTAAAAPDENVLPSSATSAPGGGRSKDAATSDTGGSVSRATSPAMASKGKGEAEGDDELFNFASATEAERELLESLTADDIPTFFDSPPKPSAALRPEELVAIEEAFEGLPDGMGLQDFENRIIVPILGLSRYIAGVLFGKIDEAKTGTITIDMLKDFWSNRFILHDAESNFFYGVKEDVNDSLWSTDFEPVIAEILERYPCMEFLKTAPDFQKRYIDTVIGRVFYVLDPHSTGKITLERLRESKFVATWKSIDAETDLNNIRDFFCYEHFYVIYCKFWELDGDHDFRLDKQDLLKYDTHAFSRRAVDRIVAVAGEKFASGSPDHLSYEDFIYFLINDEDKTTDRSIEFWFRVVDLDGDGVIRDHEMLYFYDQQAQRLEALCQEVVPFEDILCQMNDMVGPAIEGQYRLDDFRRSRRWAGLFFNVLLSLTKFVQYEQRDPFLWKQELADFPDGQYNDWDRFCRREYARLALDDDGDDDYEEVCSAGGEDCVGGVVG